MNNQFITTGNTMKFDDLCAELANPGSLIGPSLAMITGPAGRGKSEAAKHYATQTDAIYIPPLNVRSPAMVLREIAFELAKIRPTRSEACLGIIGEEMAKNRRLIIIDEADLLSMQILEMLRNLNERYACPIAMIGEDELKGRIASRRRLASRIRRKMEFGPVTQEDIAFFFHRAMGLKLSKDVTVPIQRHSNGDWRPVLTLAVAIERAMTASGINEITPELVTDVIKNA
jgi:DNA transposition AAA+ family ATPase